MINIFWLQISYMCAAFWLSTVLRKMLKIELWSKQSNYIELSFSGIHFVYRRNLILKKEKEQTWLHEAN